VIPGSESATESWHSFESGNFPLSSHL